MSRISSDIDFDKTGKQVSYLAVPDTYFHAQGSRPDPSILASLDYVRLLWATLFGYLIFDQLPGVATWFGAIIVIAAAIFTINGERGVNAV